MRTFDAERDIELNCTRCGSDGTISMELAGPVGSLHFTMSTTFEPGSPKAGIVRHVRHLGIPQFGFTVDETREIIREALEAFKGMHGLHPEETVRVIFI